MLATVRSTREVVIFGKGHAEMGKKQGIQYRGMERKFKLLRGYLLVNSILPSVQIRFGFIT